MLYCAKNNSIPLTTVPPAHAKNSQQIKSLCGESNNQLAYTQAHFSA